MSTEVLFVGHGSPMMVIEDNPYRTAWESIAQTLKTPRAILCISAHWETTLPTVSTAENPRTIHDFGGFPETLYQITYPAPGAPFLLEEIRSLITASPLTHTINITGDDHRGLDHGAWTVLKSLFPKADIPVAQLSLATSLTWAQHAHLAQVLKPLRQHGVMIVCSGNIVHNLRRLTHEGTHHWTKSFDAYIAQALMADNLQAMINPQHANPDFTLAVPTAEHYLPMLYAAAMRLPTDTLTFFAEGFDLGALSMRSFMFR